LLDQQVQERVGGLDRVGGHRRGVVHGALLEQAEAVVVDRLGDVVQLRLLVGGGQRDGRRVRRQPPALDDLDDGAGVGQLLGVQALVRDGLGRAARPADAVGGGLAGSCDRRDADEEQREHEQQRGRGTARCLTHRRGRPTCQSLCA